ncbi:hypothetical protein D9758_017154 [Tetrapyrgos nigripes]|uniref:Uncharacterized protein n=1 Tax=Tetrapyrgos nigripes TaxID=182062 RepID=A0A8H5BT81_9AGAR|nr:hypothetical protein D9758_017154 [Tetrapyrgos nigripes]
MLKLGVEVWYYWTGWYEDGLSANTTDQNSSPLAESASSPDPVATDVPLTSTSSNSGISSRTLAAAITTPLAILSLCGVCLFWFWRRRIQNKRLKRSSHLILDPPEPNFGDMREANTISGSGPGQYRKWNGNGTRPGGLSDFVVEPFGSSPDLSWGKRSLPQPQPQPQPQPTQFSPSLFPDADTHLPTTMTSLEVASSAGAPPSYRTRQ